jgi:phosphonate transport system substrate-binding protein
MKSKPFLFKPLFLFGLICTLILCDGCKSKAKHYEPTYSNDSSTKKILLFGVPTQSDFELTDLLVKYLNKRLMGAQIQTVGSSNFLDYMKKIDDRYFGFTTVNGIKALECARNGYAIVGREVDEQGYAGTILVNNDSSINTFADLKGKTVATPGYPALAGHMLQTVYLQKMGVSMARDVKFKYLQSFESVFLNIYLGRCSAGFSTITSWNGFKKRRPEVAQKITAKWVTPAIVGIALVIRNDVDKKIAWQLKNLFFSMHTNEEGRTALAKLGLLKYDPADSTTFQPVKQLLKEYNDLVKNRKQ